MQTSFFLMCGERIGKKITNEEKYIEHLYKKYKKFKTYNKKDI